MRPLLLVLLLPGALGLLSGCQDDDEMPEPGAALSGTRWMLTEVESSPVATSSYSESARSYLEFQAATRTTAGLGPCNSFGGTFSLGATPGALNISAQASTRATCGGQALEDRYLSALPRVVSYRISGRQLYLYDASNTLQPLLIFRAAR